MSRQLSSQTDTILIKLFASPSWLSTLSAVLVGVLVIGGTIAITHLGTTVQQSLLGLQMTYQHSSVGANVNVISTKWANNIVLNNSFLFVLWGSVGLLVYSITHAIMNEFKQADTLFHELGYVHANRRTILWSAGGRAAVRVLAFTLWWLLLRTFIYILLPYGIATAHASALHLASITDWGLTLLAGFGCTLCVHALVVLARLALMRPRMLGDESTL